MISLFSCTFIFIFSLHFEVWNQRHPLLLKRGEGEWSFWPVWCHSTRACCREKLIISIQMLWEKFIACITCLWCSISYKSWKNSKWNKTKVSISLMPCHNSVCQGICALSPNAALSLCINFAGRFVYKAEEQNLQPNLPSKSVRSCRHLFPSQRCGNWAIPLGE